MSLINAAFFASAHQEKSTIFMKRSSRKKVERGQSLYTSSQDVNRSFVGPHRSRPPIRSAGDYSIQAPTMSIPQGYSAFARDYLQVLQRPNIALSSSVPTYSPQQNPFLASANNESN